MGNVTAKTSGDIASFMTPAKTNITSLKVHFSPKQLGEGDPSPENVREIVGWDGVEVNRCGKNIAHIVGYSATAPASSDPSLRKTSNNYGTTINTTDFSLPDTKIIITQSSYTTKYDPVSYRNGYFAVVVDNLDFTKKYNVSFNVDDIISNPLNVDLSRIRAISPAGTGFEPPAKIDGNRLFFKNVPFTPHSKYPNRKSFEIRNAGMSFTLSEFMVTPVDDEDFEYKPYQGTIDTINWASNVGIVYGGYVDLISGELVEEYIYTEPNDNQWHVDTNYAYQTGHPAGVAITKTTYKKNICNYWKNNKWDNRYFLTVNENGLLVIGKTVVEETFNGNYTADGIAEIFANFKTNNLPLIVTYPLKTPITHQLTPTQLSSFIGQNNFWSNADYVEIEYELKETEDIQKCRKKIILNQPHIESVKDDLVNFTTNMKAPLKECKVYFEPIQEGEGDPSPDNIRPINGWEGMQLTQANENLIPESLPDNVITGMASRGKIAGASNAKIFAIPIPKNTPLHIQKISGDNSSGNVGLLEDGEPQVGDFWINGKGLTNAINQNYSANRYSWMGIQSYNLEEAEAWFTTRELMISVGNTRKEYVAPKGYSTQYISWQSETGIVYGGKLDVLNGKLMVTNYFCTPDNATRITYGIDSQSNLPYAFFWLAQKAIGTSLSARTLCSMYKAGNVQNVDKALRMWTSEADIWDSDLDVTSLDTVKAYFADLIIVYPLAKPITIQLTPQQLFTLKGTNNIWSNSNGQTEVKFWTH